MTVSSAELIAFSFGPLLSALELVDLSLQTLQFQPFDLLGVSCQLIAGPPLGLEPLRLKLLGFPSLDLQPVRLDAFLAPTLPLEPLRLLGRSLSLCLDPLCLLLPSTLGSQLSSGGAFSFDPFGLAPPPPRFALAPCAPAPAGVPGLALPGATRQLSAAALPGASSDRPGQRLRRSSPRTKQSVTAVSTSPTGSLGLPFRARDPRSPSQHAPATAHRGSLGSGRVRLIDPAVLQQIVGQIGQS